MVKSLAVKTSAFAGTKVSDFYRMSGHFDSSATVAEIENGRILVIRGCTKMKSVRQIN